MDRQTKCIPIIPSPLRGGGFLRKIETNLILLYFAVGNNNYNTKQHAMLQASNTSIPAPPQLELLFTSMLSGSSDRGPGKSATPAPAREISMFASHDQLQEHTHRPVHILYL